MTDATDNGKTRLTIELNDAALLDDPDRQAEFLEALAELAGVPVEEIENATFTRSTPKP